MITLNEKLQNIRNKLSDFLHSQSQSSKICAFRVSHIPTQIENVDVGINKIPLYAVDSVPYVITENELRGLTEIGNWMFYNCKSLTNITIPDSVKSIGWDAFSCCESLTNIVIPDSVTSIGNDVFVCCTSLTSVTIRGNITTIESSLFYECPNLANIYIHSATPPALLSKDAIPDHTTINVPVGSGDAYRNATNWSYHSARIVENSAL